jgi:tyrosine-protein kinase Etk/Wzc
LRLDKDIQTPREGDAVQSNDINLLDLVLVLVRHKRLLWATPAILGACAVAYALMVTPTFDAETSLLPPQSQSSAATMMLSQFGGLAGAAGNALGLKSPNDIYVAMLKSREIGAALNQRFKLQDWYRQESVVDALRTLTQATNISNDKDGLIRITVSDRSAELSANLANAYVEELRRLSRTMAVTEAAERRQYFEGQLQHTRVALADAEVALKQLQQKTGLLQLEAQGRATIEAVANLRAQISIREVQLAAAKDFATNENPEYRRLSSELIGLKEQLAKMTAGGSDDNVFSRKGMPEAGLEYVRKTRELKYQETLYELLSKQYELAKLDESKDGANIQVLDKAVPAEKKARPKRMLIVVMSLLAGAFLGMLLAFLKEGIQRIGQGEEQRERIKSIRAAWSRPG